MTAADRSVWTITVSVPARMAAEAAVEIGRVLPALHETLARSAAETDPPRISVAYRREGVAA